MGIVDWIVNNPISLGYGQGDIALGGNHLVDIKTPFHTTITAPASGTITNYQLEPWGGQVTWKLDQPINGVPYAFIIHLDQLNPNLGIGQHINAGDVLGLSGGQNSGGTNPETSYWSSQPQTGFGLSNGPIYGTGAGWVQNPLGFPQLDPTNYISSLKSGGMPNSSFSLVTGSSTPPPVTGTAYFNNLGQKVGIFLIAITLIGVGAYILFYKQINSGVSNIAQAAIKYSTGISLARKNARETENIHTERMVQHSTNLANRIQARNVAREKMLSERSTQRYYRKIGIIQPKPKQKRLVAPPPPKEDA
jgi:hypothetical protein